MFEILYPRQESNLQLTRLKLVVFTVSPRGYIGHGFGFPICVHSFCSCVILREITRCPPKNPYFLSAQKFVKRPYCRLVYFNRPSSTFYIQEPIPSYGENESGWPDGKVGFEPTDSRQFPTECFASKTSYQTFWKNWWLRLPSSTWVCLYHFSVFFLRDFHFKVNVNLLTNRTLFSFKIKKFVTNYPLPTDFS